MGSSHDIDVDTPMNIDIDAGGPQLKLRFGQRGDEPLRLSALGPAGAPVELSAGQPFVEVVTVDSGHEPGTSRSNRGAASAGLRYRDHEQTRQGASLRTSIRLDDDRGLAATIHLEVLDGAAAFRSCVALTNTGTRTRTVRSITSAALRVGVSPAGHGTPEQLQLSSAESCWIGESRWSTVPLRRVLPDLRSEAHDLCDARGSHVVTATGAWSSDGALPVGVLAANAGGEGSGLAWQVEHNGPWRWEVGETAVGVYLAASGPNDDDHQWLLPLLPGQTFETVPVTVAIGDGLQGALAELTAFRRAARRPHPDTAVRPVIFNDYMNTLRGDPTTAKLLPLVDAAAHVGAEVFCIDAGWYDDSGDWWPSVGQWQPSRRRFPGGLEEVLDRIHSRGMVPGLWLEPEVVGVLSPVADHLPAEAFLQRGGERVVENQRYNLDLRHSAARAHLDEVIDRLVTDFGVGYFKLDYNINPGAGTDLGGTSPGVGLLEHNRAHLAWLDGVLDRHPHVVLENCASGAMRQDPALLSRLQLQSTSDQQSAWAYPPIAASAPMSMPPEQAASWAYPQPEMSDEEIAFTLCTAMLGRFYLSGHLDRMSPTQRALVAEAVAVHRELRPFLGEALPGWPLGLDQWDADWVSFTLTRGDTTLLALWWRGDGPSRLDVSLPALRAKDVRCQTAFPAGLAPWPAQWDADAGVLRVHAATSGPAARVLQITRLGSPAA